MPTSLAHPDPTPDGTCPCGDQRPLAVHAASCDLIDPDGRPVPRTLALRALRQELDVDVSAVASTDQMVLLIGRGDRLEVFGSYPHLRDAPPEAARALEGRRVALVDLDDAACQASLALVTDAELAQTQPPVALWGTDLERLPAFLEIDPPVPDGRYLIWDLLDDLDDDELPGGLQVWVSDPTHPDGCRPADDVRLLKRTRPAAGDPGWVLLIR